MSVRLVFLKLGGSLITVKNQPRTPRLEMLERLGREISEALAQDPDLRILLGHGSGSFGHITASQYHTREGVKTTREWEGFAEVWHQAAELDHLVMTALQQAHLPVIVFPPSASVMARDGKVATWELDPLHAALNNGWMPLVYGDVAFDQVRGGTILSTEDLFSHLAIHLRPNCLLFAGQEEGVFADYPDHNHLLNEITPTSFPQVESGLKGSSAIDVTGGMLDKVRQMLYLIGEIPGLQGMIFSGERQGNVRDALLGESLGTVIRAG
jgi:isopentenyl phosphate kinase